MELEANLPAKFPKIRAKAVALPVEHGSWGFLMEPLVAGLAIAPSVAAIWITIMVVGAFLLRQPLKVILSGGIAGLRLPQAALALKFAALFTAIFLIGGLGVFFSARPESFGPFVIVLPFAVYQIYCDAKRKSRGLLAELLGSTALTASVAVITLAAGWDLPRSLALWGIMIARLIPSIIYVRNRLRLEKGKPYTRLQPFAAHVLALFFATALAVFGYTSHLMIPMYGILLVRCVAGLSSYRKKVKATRIGVGEVIYGTLTVICLIVGCYTGF
ncbi:MAG: YwiC-like family protein [Pyrinomonadaceae bacterium]